MAPFLKDSAILLNFSFSVNNISLSAVFEYIFDVLKPIFPYFHGFILWQSSSAGYQEEKKQDLILGEMKQGVLPREGCYS